MKSILYVLGLFLLVSSCHQKTSNQVFFDQSDITKSTLNSVIEAKVIEHIENTTVTTEMCKKHPCYASLEITRIVQNGQNYHGQFSEGDTIEAYFNFTLDNTSKLFPQLNKTLPGLNKGTIFQAELFEKEGIENTYSIQLYVLKN